MDAYDNYEADIMEIEIKSLMYEIECSKEILQADKKLDVSSLLDIILHCKILAEKRRKQEIATNKIDKKIMQTCGYAEILLKLKARFVSEDHRSEFLHEVSRTTAYIKTCTDFDLGYETRRDALRDFYQNNKGFNDQ